MILLRRIAVALLAFPLAAYLVYLFPSLPNEVRAPIVAALLAFTAGLITFWLQKRRDLDFKIRENKIDVYQQLQDLLLEFINPLNLQSTTPADDVVRRFREVNYALIAWGDEKVILECHTLQRKFSDISELVGDPLRIFNRSMELRTMLANIIKAIRLDLGHKDMRLTTEIVESLFMPLNFDPEEERRRLASGGI